MHCASRNEPAVLGRQRSPCAELYLHRALKILRPEVVVAVGSGVKRHLKQHFDEMFLQMPIVKMEHPGTLFGRNHEAKIDAMQPTISAVREILSKGSQPI